MQGTLSQETNCYKLFSKKHKALLFQLLQNKKLQLSNSMLKLFDEEILSH